MASPPRAPHVVLVVGARPNFVKAAPILHAIEAKTSFRVTLVHTGQHYDAKLSDVFFDELGIRRPDVMLGVGSGSHGVQTARLLESFEKLLEERRAAGDPVDLVIVVGDVNSTMAAALVASKLQVPIAHVEAGLRSGDRSMPEEINRLVTDAISDLLLCTEPAALENLRLEGHPDGRLHLVGNVMIDTLHKFLPQAATRPTLAQHGLTSRGYALATLHRPGNVDDPRTFRPLLLALIEIAERLPVLFPAHPRTVARIREFGLGEVVERSQIKIMEPQGYLDFLCLTSNAKFLITDSGGLQEEATALEVPCLTLRPNTERPITVEEGSSVLIGDDLNLLRTQVAAIHAGTYRVGRRPPLWDGRAAERIAVVLESFLGARRDVRRAA